MGKRDTKFKPGQSGNPAGRPPGVGPAAKLRKAIAGELPGVIESMVTAAKAGDTAAARLLLERAIPAFKPESQPVVLPANGAGSLSERAGAILDAAGSGNLPPDVASALVAAVGTLAKIIEVDEIMRRIEALEQKQ